MADAPDVIPSAVIPSAKTPADSQCEMREIILPNDTNTHGNALGGRVLHRIDVPFFETRDIALKSTTEFRNVEKKLLDLIYAPA